MREILFRGKKMYPFTEEWVFGNLVEYNRGPMIYVEKNGGFEIHYVDKNTVGQFTGQLDKNHVKIYEGDIIVCRDEKAIIAFDNNSAMFIVKFMNTKNEWSFLNAGYLGEVIGNIYDNPELAPSQSFT